MTNEIVAFASSLARRSYLKIDLTVGHPVLDAEENLYEMTRAKLRNLLIDQDDEHVAEIHKDIKAIARSLIGHHDVALELIEHFSMDELKHAS